MAVRGWERARYEEKAINCSVDSFPLPPQGLVRDQAAPLGVHYLNLRLPASKGRSCYVQTSTLKGPRAINESDKCGVIDCRLEGEVDLLYWRDSGERANLCLIHF